MVEMQRKYEEEIKVLGAKNAIAWQVKDGKDPMPSTPTL